MSLEDQDGTRPPSAIFTQHLKIRVEQTPSRSVSEMSLIIGGSISTISNYFKKNGKGNKLNSWDPHELSESQTFRRFKVCPMLHLRNSNGTFLDRIVTCDKKN